MPVSEPRLHTAAPNSSVRSRDEKDIRAFLNSLARKSPKTAESYRQGITAFALFTSRQGMPLLEDVTREHIESWLDSLHARGNSPGTLRLRQSTLRAFFNWQVGLDLRPDSPMAKIRPETLPEKVLPTYRAADVQRVVESIPRKGPLLDLRDRTILLLLADSGLRASELCGLDLSDLEEQRLLVRHAKREKQRYVPFGRETAAALHLYLRRLEERPDAPLFLTRGEKRLTPGDLRALLMARFRAAGLAFHGAHAFRRGWACTLLENGENVLNLKELGGWSDLAMCYRYAKATATERALTQYQSPMDRLRK